MSALQKTAGPQIKVCGLTVPEEAAACAAMGADAIGLVFYPPSPRHLEADRAAAITAVLPSHVSAVGVFVNPTWEMLSEIILRSRLGGVQLHGDESPALIDQIQEHFGVKVIKGLFAERPPYFADAGRFSVPAYLLECGRGAQPGGNALSWDWGAAAAFARSHSTVLSGGLTPDNVAAAIAAALPNAVDASSGLEAAPGRKDLRKVERFLKAVRETNLLYERAGISLRPVF
ncbi:MAG: phosphoribosylanthranilate isomerase [Desulfobacteraceae bacterium]|nr:MAG: phosphoribosylanthranilate isomerase [Desulfobacteraceae bacterium]